MERTEHPSLAYEQIGLKIPPFVNLVQLGCIDKTCNSASTLNPADAGTAQAAILKANHLHKAAFVQNKGFKHIHPYNVWLKVLTALAFLLCF